MGTENTFMLTSAAWVSVGWREKKSGKEWVGRVENIGKILLENIYQVNI